MATYTGLQFFFVDTV